MSALPLLLALVVQAPDTPAATDVDPPASAPTSPAATDVDPPATVPPPPAATTVEPSASVARPAVSPVHEPWRLNPPGRWFALRASAELGFVGVVKHDLQFGKDGTYFDMRKEGGQDVLFPFFRFTGEFAIKQRHTLIFLIQPLKLKTTNTIDRDVRVDDVEFSAGTPMAIKYDFGFYRFAYMYDLLKAPQHELGVGVALQIRNATIDFASRDGELLASNRNVGVVPLLKLRGRWTPKRGQGFWLGAEVDGAYIRGKVISGTRDYFVGALVDASIRAGFEVPRAGDVFVNVRYVGGGARGTDSTPKPGKDGYAENWLHTMALSLGMYIR
ncbi:MAG TPA: hypothetical protein VGB85_19160 [Nannocystis sp.]